MLMRQLSTIWWSYTYPSEHKELMRYVKMCVNSGKSWENSLRRTYQENPDLLHPALVRLCTELGPRLFSPLPVFEEGDGASIIGKHGRFPVTVISVSPKLVTVQEDLPCLRSDSSSVLYLPRGREGTHNFSRRTDGSWKLRGSRSPIRLIIGRSFRAHNY